MTVWQLTLPSRRRSVAELMLRYSIALLGPGETGAVSFERVADGSVPAPLRRFAREAQPDDAIILRVGREHVTAVGEIVGRYEYLPQFEDVEGVDLQHARRVRWYPFAVEQGREHGLPPAGNVAFVKVTTPALIELAGSALNRSARMVQPTALPELPAVQPVVDDRRPQVRRVVAEARDLWQLYRAREHFGEPPAESELVAHLVVPLLRALGWQPERIAVEWKKIDVALFRSLPRTPKNVSLVLEAKKMGAVGTGALKQARDYLKAIGEVTDIVVTDGFTYRRHAAANNYSPSGYANLARLTEGGVQLLDEMSAGHGKEGSR